MNSHSSSKARILVVSSDAARSSVWSRIVEALGYDCVTSDPGAALAQARLCRADCALVESGFEAGVLDDMFRTRAGDVPGMPLLLLEPRLADAFQARMPSPRDADAIGHIRARVDASVEVKVMADEWRRRHAVFTSLGHQPELPAAASALAARQNASILVSGAPSADYPVLESAFSDERTVLIGAFTPSMTVDYLGRNTFDLLVLSVGHDIDDYAPVVSAIRKNERLKDLPVVVLAQRPGLEAPGDALRAGVSDVLQRPLGAARQWDGEADWVKRIRANLNESLQRRALTNVLKAFPPEELCDPVTGLASGETFEAYLSQLLIDQRAQTRPWSLGVIDLKIGARNDGWSVETGNRVFREAALALTKLTRGVDFCAHVGPREIAIVMPNTTLPDAEARITAIARELEAMRLDGGGAQSVTLAPATAVLSGTHDEDSARDILVRGQTKVRGAAGSEDDPATLEVRNRRWAAKDRLSVARRAVEAG